MNDQEGVIKYQLEHVHKSINIPFGFNELSAWRAIIYRLGLIGQVEHRYDNLGFGNISQRLNAHSQQFIISGTQTGHLEYLQAEHYALVERAEPHDNYLKSSGLFKPSSESLTHASIYTLNSKVQSVIHVHSPEIWRNTMALNVPHISAKIPYGTVDMAVAVEHLFQTGHLDNIALFTMLGHEDGVVAFGGNLQEAAEELIKYLALAICFELPKNL